MNNHITLGIIAGIASCFLFLIFHHITISNIWLSSPFMLGISALAGYALSKSYFELFDNYKFITWFGYNLYFIISLTMLGFLSVLVFSPTYSSSEILDAGGGPPDGLIIGALPLTITWLVVSAILIVMIVNKSLTGLPIVLLTSGVLFLTLGLNISILGFVEIEPQHQYLVEKFMAMNVMIGVSFLGFFSVLKPLV